VSPPDYSKKLQIDFDDVFWTGGYLDKVIWSSSDTDHDEQKFVLFKCFYTVSQKNVTLFIFVIT